jgi:hypothetical protein
MGHVARSVMRCYDVLQNGNFDFSCFILFATLQLKGKSYQSFGVFQLLVDS